MKSSTNWTKEETIIAFNVYCKIPFKSNSKTNPIIVKYANIIGRSASALNMKVGNFGRPDPELKSHAITGLTNGSQLEEEVWNEFNGNWDKLAFESERLIARFQNKPIEEIAELDLSDLTQGTEREAVIKARVNQSIFRPTVLVSYDKKCCITGLSIAYLLTESHIVPWKEDVNNRLNPCNGLCLNSIHDRAFDHGYITVTPQFTVLVSRYFDAYSNEKVVHDFFKRNQNKPVDLPNKFLPSKEFLGYHYNKIFKK